MGTKIIETGSTAGGIAKVQYKDESGNIIFEFDDNTCSLNCFGTYKINGVDVINSKKTSTSVPSGVATTIFTGLDEEAKYDVFVYIPGYHITQCYISAVFITASIGAGVCFVQNITSPSSISLSVSGLELKVTQNTGITQDVYLNIKKMI